MMTAAGPSLSAAPRRLGRALAWVDHALTRLPILLVGLLLGLIAFIKSGIEIPGLVTVWDPQTWPDPVGTYPHMSYGLRTVGWAVGADTFAAYAGISAAATVLALVIMALILRSAAPQGVNRFVVIVALGGPLAWVLFSTFGRPDPLTLAGGVLIGALGRRWYWAAAGSVVAVLGNADQAVVLSLSLLVATLARPLRAWRLPALLAFSIAAISSVALTRWGELAGVPTRGGLFGVFWRQSLQQFFAAAPLEVYAGLGLGALVLLWAVLAGTWRNALPIVVGGLVIPLAFTATTLDQTRVFVGCASAVSIAILVRWGPEIHDFLSARLAYPLAAVFVAVTLLPAVEIAGNIVRVPWISYVPFMQSYLVAPFTGGG